MHKASVRLALLGMTISSLGASNRTKVPHSAGAWLSWAICAEGWKCLMSLCWVRGTGGGQKIIKNKLMRGIHYSINASNVSRGQSLEGEMKKLGWLARMKMSGCEDESRTEWEIMMNQRGELGLLLGCEIEARYFNTSKLTIKTEWAPKC